MPADVVERAYAFLRGHTKGDLRFDEHLRPLEYVVAPDGRLVAPVMVAMLTAVDTVLFVPEAVDDALELQVTLLQFRETGEGGAMADRWRIHHGSPPDVNWAHFVIDAARFEGMVIDGDALLRENPLERDEPALCRRFNQGRTDDLRLLCRRYAEIELESPVMVAIDPLGIDVRGTFDVVRVPAARPMATAEEAEQVLEEMVRGARADRARTDDRPRPIGRARTDDRPRPHRQ